MRKIGAFPKCLFISAKIHFARYRTGFALSSGYDPFKTQAAVMLQELLCQGFIQMIYSINFAANFILFP